MNLSTRIRRATEEKKLPQTPLLVFEATRDVLESHPLVRALGVHARDVHAEIVALRAVQRDDKQHASSRVPPDCPECRLGYVMLDEREGQRVCDRCGIVVSESLNIHPDFESSYHSTPSEMPISPMLAHWNQFVGLSTAQLAEASPRLPNNVETRSGATKLAAALLEPILEMPNEETTRRKVAATRHLDNVGTTVRNPEFPCAACGALFFDAKTARLHCKRFGK
jgi:hypothetical protein